MTAAKIAITLPERQLAHIRRAVRTGKASSVSGYIAKALDEQEQRESLRALVRDLIEEHGKPSRKETAWAKRVLGRSHGA
ncbi:MAG: toxin-antitoxin system antitoxin subunit [Deltaproteobacteria bacterium]